MTRTPDWFRVDKEGLAKQSRKRGLAFALFELWQNIRDQNVTQATISFMPLRGGMYRLVAEDDDPEGFQVLAHAYTLFAPSTKMGNPEQAGRFNLGEKLVLALCEYGSISTTKGTVVFGKSGREQTDEKRERGSVFDGVLKATRAEWEDACRTFKGVIPKPGVTLLFNEEEIQQRIPLKVIEATLPTEIPDEEGILRPTARQTTIEIYEPLPDEEPMLYELGIPVVATGDRWHYSVQQKVPLNKDRDNVTPAYLEKVRTLVLNEMHDFIRPEDATSLWVEQAAANEHASSEAVKEVLDKRFGEKRVAYDPSDPEANNLAVAKGYTMVYGRSLSAGIWENARKAQAILPAGQVTPSNARVLLSLAGEPTNLLPEEKWTEGMRAIVEFVRLIGGHILGVNLTIQIVSEIRLPAAMYGVGGPFVFNVTKLGYRWFADGVTAKVISLIIHELAHHYCDNHLSEEYYEALCDIGGKIVTLVAEDPTVREKIAIKE